MMCNPVSELADATEPNLNFVALDGATRKNLDQMISPEIAIPGSGQAGPEPEGEFRNNPAGFEWLARTLERFLSRTQHHGLLGLELYATPPIRSGKTFTQLRVNRVTQRNFQPLQNAVKRLGQQGILLV
jgi:hypothetical protein